MKYRKILIISCLSLILLSACKKKQEDQISRETDLETHKESIQESIVETIESPKDTESESETETETETESEIANANSLDLALNYTLEIDKSFSVYSEAESAFNQTNSTITYQPGTYYVYAITDKAVNVTRNFGKPGGWANYRDINPATQIVEKAAPVQEVARPSTTTDVSNLDTTNNAWSWSYPDTRAWFSQYGGIYKLNSSSIYLTFDNGYEYQNLTASILDTLAANNVKAVFFTTSDYLLSNPGLSRRIVNEGHNLANHTDKHLSQGMVSPSQVRDDILGWEKTYRQVIGAEPTTSLMRPPTGSYSQASLAVAQNLGYKSVFWNVALKDWETDNQPDPQASLNTLLTHNQPGSIVLLHSVSQTNANILDLYIKQTRAQGYNFSLLQ